MQEIHWKTSSAPQLADPGRLAQAAAEVVAFLNDHADLESMASEEATEFFGVQPGAGRYIAEAIRRHSMDDNVKETWLGTQAPLVSPEFNAQEAFDSAFGFGFLVAMRYHRNEQVAACASS